MNPPHALCPCGSDKQLDDCCRPYLIAASCPEHPEQLMRSRFTAFVSKDAEYLYNTLHPDARTPETKTDIQGTLESIYWHSLLVLASRVDDQGYGFVEFVAFYQRRGANQATRVEQLHEHSTFIREDGHWFYRRGDILNPYSLGRNEPCWCGSGTKLKKCHATMQVDSTTDKLQ